MDERDERDGLPRTVEGGPAKHRGRIADRQTTAQRLLLAAAEPVPGCPDLYVPCACDLLLHAAVHACYDGAFAQAPRDLDTRENADDRDRDAEALDRPPPKGSRTFTGTFVVERANGAIGA